MRKLLLSGLDPLGDHLFFFLCVELLRFFLLFLVGGLVFVGFHLKIVIMNESEEIILKKYKTRIHFNLSSINTLLIPYGLSRTW